MLKRILNFSKCLRISTLAALCPILVFTSNTYAAQGCGWGYHRSVDGRCVVKRYCWQNKNGKLICQKYPFNLVPVLGQNSL